MKPVQTQIAEDWWIRSQSPFIKRPHRSYREMLSWYFLILAAQQGEI